MVRDNNKCINCRRCIAACEKTQGIGVIGANNRGIDTNIGTPFEVGLANVPCISCGQCTVVCPTGALVEKDDTDMLAAVKYGLRLGYRSFRLYGANGGRLEHTIANVDNIAENTQASESAIRDTDMVRWCSSMKDGELAAELGYYSYDDYEVEDEPTYNAEEEER